jgi:predicted MFS family arabinose efflux permease
MAGFFVCGFQITLIATHIPNYVIERGLDGWTGAAILSLIGLFNIFGTLTMGYLADKYSKKILLSGLYFLRGIIIILFLMLPASNILAISFGICFGFLWLATIPATFGIVAQVFGTKYLAMLSGIVFLSHQFGSFSGAYLGGYFYDNFGSYDYAWYLSILLSFFATLMHLPINENPIKRVATA